VIDEAGSPIEGAEITVTNTETGLERTGTAGANGQFLFGVLPVGNYTVLVQHVGMQPQVYSFRLGVGETVPVEVTLLPGEVLTEEIAVYATATALQTTSSGENFDYRETVEELPIQDRDIQDIAMLSPNVSPTRRSTSVKRPTNPSGFSSEVGQPLEIGIRRLPPGGFVRVRRPGSHAVDEEATVCRCRRCLHQRGARHTPLESARG
jgi:hypothetical protein